MQSVEAAIPNSATLNARQSDQAFERLKGEIISCHLAPGAHFSEAELSLRFGIARAATRAALMRLAQVGLVQPFARHGFVVSPITIASVRELFELRLMTEPQAAAMAVNRIDTKRLRAINRAPQDATTQAEQISFVQANRAFHREIAAATGNGRVLHLLESLADEMERLVHLGLFTAGGSLNDQRDADQQHEAMIAAFEARDAVAAERASKLHIEHARGLAMDRLIGGYANLALS